MNTTRKAVIAKVLRRGGLKMEIRQYRDGDYGFDWYPADEEKERERVRRMDLESAERRANELMDQGLGGRLDRAHIDETRFRAFIKWESTRRGAVAIPTLVQRFLESKRTKGKSKKYLQGIACTLKHFSLKFTGNFLDVTMKELEDWLESRKYGKDQKKIGNVRWNNMLADIVALARFARKDGSIGSDLTAAEMMDRKKISREVQTYTVEEMRRMLDLCPEDWIPLLVFGAFCGLRPEEICPEHRNEKPGLDWKDVNWEKGKVIVPAKVAKDRRKRFAPLTDTARAFLTPFRGRTGPVTPHNRQDWALMELKASDGVKWKPDALRHSFASYRLAITQDINALSLEMGNSVKVIHQHYLDVQHLDEAQKWFAIRPRLAQK